ncbi:MAG: hypothetical protein M1431_00265 [Candidatus Thermoplasmatota archaeon]|nr:hypothetical protein [Candidatus Thermoplasmatota archaeon]
MCYHITTYDAARIMNKPNNYVSKLLSNNKKVRRIERGKYYITNGRGINIYEIASQVVFPSYVSMFAAFQFYSVTEQFVVKYSVVTLKRHRPIIIENNAVEFIKIQKERFFGYKKNGNAYVATIEKAIVDSLYLGSPPFSYIKEAFAESLRRKIINVDLLVDFALRMKTKATAKRVQSLLKSENIHSVRLQGAL